ncbi:EF-P lysine aminoacylase EpmA [Marinicella sp. W31]|uniref:EF-P lysine aminoacylase EpmA n=1 Tax=Marinicella sp. W31 TaxID=3023713 RepID=UPI003757FF91
MNTPQWQPQCPRSIAERRAFFYQSIRKFFTERDVLEVETPVLSCFGNTDPNIESFSTQGLQADHSRAFLRTSPEFFHKRLLASGWGDIFEISKVFRSREHSTIHNPEFTLLEWYRVNYSMDDLMWEMTDFIQYLCAIFAVSEPSIERYSYHSLFLEQLDIDPMLANVADLNAICQKYGYTGSDLNKNQCLDFLFALVVQPSLPLDSCVLIHNFPASQAALAQIDPDHTDSALRFEMVWKNMELANGYQELICPHEQQQRFEADNAQRLSNQQPELPMDEYLVASMHHGLPACSGVAVGLDRLLMCLLDLQQLSDVMPFPADRA